MGVIDNLEGIMKNIENGVSQTVDSAIGKERSESLTDSINRAINRLENAVNNLDARTNGAVPGQQGYPPPQQNANWSSFGQQNGYAGQTDPYAGQNNYYGAQQNGYPGQQNYYTGQPGGYGSQQSYYGGQPNGYACNQQYGGYYGGAQQSQPNPGAGYYGGPQPQPQYRQANEPARCVPPEALLNDDYPITKYVTVSDNCSGRETSFELPPEFVSMNTGSGAEMLYMYRADDADFRSPRLIKPYICIIPAGGGIPLEQDCTAACIGLMEIRSKGWVNYRGKAARYYGFTRRDESRQLLVLFCEPEVVGSPLGNKMTEVLDHAAETYRET